MNERMNKLLQTAALGKDEGILIHKPSNMFYLSGYTGEGLIAAGHGFQAIITDFRYTEQAERQAPGFDVLMVEKGVSHAMLASELFAQHGVKCVRYEDDEVTVRSFEAIKEAIPGVEFASLKNAPETIRRIKDQHELDCIEEACNISCKAFDQLLGFIKPGMTEKQLQIKLEFLMLELGAEALAFNTIVASGVNGSLPHAIPSDKKVEMGEMITFDFGAKKGGYCADMTRTISLGQPSAEMKKIYDTVLYAQQTCEDMLAPGKVCKDIDTVARKIIDDAGYAGRFGHGLGHSVGIDIHEDPRLSQLCEDPLEVNQTITVEPGIYVPGLGGVRIEDTCAITENGGRTLVHAQKALLIL
ncbi:MAG: aminopeptidase P family protein [Clostridia bacterium]|nr:aminopeptidase P family protein [Clostridia bacterium]